MSLLNKLMKLSKNELVLPKLNEFVVIDVETSGLNPEENRIVEISLIRSDGQNITDKWTHLINPQGSVGPTEIHGISQEDVSDEPTFSDLQSEIIQRIDGFALIAHNARFDLAFLRSEFNRLGKSPSYLPSICTFEASRYYLPNLNRRRLSDCCNYLGIEIQNKHSAEGDAVATSKLFAYYMAINKNPEPRLSDLRILNNPGRINFVNYSNEITTPRVQNTIVKKRSVPVAKSRKNLAEKLQKTDIAKVLNRSFLEKEFGYLEKLTEVLLDTAINEAEEKELLGMAKIYELTDIEIENLHRNFVIALGVIAQNDERIDISEKAELEKIIKILGFSEKDLKEFLKSGKEIHHSQLAKNVTELPENWNLGEPLRIGDKIAFTGCDPEWRYTTENICAKSGLFVSSSVSKKTKILVSDGSYSGNKARDAQELGIKIVTPEEFEMLLKYIQPKLD